MFTLTCGLNFGEYYTLGVEVFLENSFHVTNKLNISLFTSTGVLRSRYQSALIRSGDQNVNITGNEVESVPGIITRNGLTLKTRFVSLSFLYSYTGESYADPLNTRVPSPNGAVGIVPSYGLLDFNSSFELSKNVKLRFNVNNVTDKQYFTKRPSFYPGPGVWPSDGRSINLSIRLRM